MATKIRLARAGAKKRPFYRIVVADVRSPRDGHFIERLGTYNPLIAANAELSEKEIASGRLRLTLNEERIKYWLSVGAKPTDRVLRFLEQAKILDSDTKRNNPNRAKPKAKAVVRAQEAIDKAKAAEDAKVAEAEAAKTAAEVPAEAEASAEPEAEAVAEAPAEAPVEASAEPVVAEAAPAEPAPTEEPSPEEEKKD